MKNYDPYSNIIMIVVLVLKSDEQILIKNSNKLPKISGSSAELFSVCFYNFLIRLFVTRYLKI